MSEPPIDPTPPTRTLATAVLRHETDAGAHYDWLIELPDAAGAADKGRGTDPDERALATWRIDAPPAEWAAGRRMPMTRIGDHRRVYLTFEGELSGGRGRVRRVDGGTARALAWSDDAVTLSVQMTGFTGRVALRAIGGGDGGGTGEAAWELTILERG